MTFRYCKYFNQLKKAHRVDRGFVIALLNIARAAFSSAGRLLHPETSPKRTIYAIEKERSHIIEPSMEKKVEFRLVFPFDCSAYDECEVIHVTDEFIVAAVSDGLKSKDDLPGGPDYYPHVVLLFDRWTFQLVNSLSVKCDWLDNVCVITEGGANKALYFDYFRERERRAVLWHLATGKLHALPSPPASTITDVISIGKLIVMFTNSGDADDEEGNFVYVYRVNVEGDGAVSCLLRREPLHAV